MFNECTRNHEWIMYRGSECPACKLVEDNIKLRDNYTDIEMENEMMNDKKIKELVDEVHQLEVFDGYTPAFQRKRPHRVRTFMH